MKGILDEEYYNHYSLLVTGVYILALKSIHPQQLELAGQMLVHFVEMYDALYGARYVLMNQHMLLHLMKNVATHGPLWSSSLFVFEDWNGDIGSYFHGTQNVASQIMKAVVCQQQLPVLVSEMPNGQAKQIVIRLQGLAPRKNRTHLVGNFYAVGKMREKSLSPNIEDNVLTALRIECVESLKLFSRLQIGDSVIHSKLYKRVSRRNSFTVAYKKECSIMYGQIECFFKAPEESRIQFGAVISPMAVSSEGHLCKEHEAFGPLCGHIVTLQEPARFCCDVVSLDAIIEVCVCINFVENDVIYVARFPNRFEKD